MSEDDGNGENPAARQRRLLNNVLAVSLVVFVAICPLPLGGDAAVVWAWSSAIIGVLAGLYWLSLAMGGSSPAVPLRRIGLVVPLFIALCLYVSLQAAPLGGIVEIVAPSGKTIMPTAISIAPATTVLTLLKWLGYGMLFLLAVQASARQQRAGAMLDWIFYAIVAHAALAMFMFTQMGDTIFGIEKWKFQGSATGTFLNRNSFATFLAFGLVIGIAMLTEALFERKRLASIETLFRVVAIVLIGVTLLATNSRMGLAAGAIGAAVVIVSAAAKARIGWRATLAITAASIVVGIWSTFAFGTGVLERVIELEGATVDRREIYAQVWEMITARPFLGFGAGTFSAGFPLFHHPPLTVEAVYERAHSTYLALWAELGLLAGSIPLLIVAIIAVRTVRAFIETKVRWTQSLAAIGVVIVAAVHSTADFSLEIQANACLFALILALGFTQPVGTNDHG